MYITHINHFDINKHDLDSMADIVNYGEFEYDLYTLIENLYEIFFISRLNEFGAHLLTLLEEDKLHDEIDIIELNATLSLLTFEEIASLKFFSLEILFIVYFLQVHTNNHWFYRMMRDIYGFHLEHLYKEN